MDFNGDGIIQIGVATAGQRNDGGYHQALVEFVQEFFTNDKVVCFKEPIISDEILRREAESGLWSLAQQGVDIVIDFGNLTGANRALARATQDGADAVYTFLTQRVHRSLVQDAKEDSLIIMSVDSADACNDETLDYDIAVSRGAINYMETILEQIANSRFREGENKVFRFS